MKVSGKSDQFLWVGNTPALDFVNTQIVQNGRVMDLLVRGRDLFHWLGEAGFLTTASANLASNRATLQALDAARDYRRELRSALEHMAVKGLVPRRIVKLTNEILARKCQIAVLVEKGRQPMIQERWIIQAPEDACVPIAYSFARFISTAALFRVRKCRNPECILFFYDTSKSGTRAWCSLDLCGNKLRAAAFRARTK